MATQLTATFANGAFHPDTPIELPNHSRVKLTIEPTAEGSGEMEDRLALWAEMREYARQHRMGSGGRRFRRDELYDRD